MKANIYPCDHMLEPSPSHQKTQVGPVFGCCFLCSNIHGTRRCYDVICSYIQYFFFFKLFHYANIVAMATNYFPILSILPFALLFIFLLFLVYQSIIILVDIYHIYLPISRDPKLFNVSSCQIVMKNKRKTFGYKPRTNNCKVLLTCTGKNGRFPCW